MPRSRDDVRSEGGNSFVNKSPGNSFYLTQSSGLCIHLNVDRSLLFTKL